MPKSTNTMPFSVKPITFHTLERAILRLERYGEIFRVLYIDQRMPHATTAKMPLTPMISDTRNVTKGIETSKNTWNDTERDACNEAHRKRSGSIRERERARNRSGDSELERNNARSVIQERFTLQDGPFALAKLRLVAQRLNGNRVRRAKRCTERERSSERDRRNEPIHHEAYTERDDEHEPDRERENGHLVIP